VAGKLTVEFKNMYIQEEISAAESFLSLNKHTKNSRRIVSFTTSQQPFVSFSEQELGFFFWKRDVLKLKLCELGLQDNTKRLQD
jgi:hypothetical protein